MVSAAATASLASEGMLSGRSSRPKPGLLLDRDGTIIVDHGYVGSIDRVEFIEGSAEAIAAFNRAGIPVAVLTNQAGVARGLYGIADVTLVHHYIAERLAECGAHIDLFLYCPYHPEGVVEDFARTSEDRKPRPGMAKAACGSSPRRARRCGRMPKRPPASRGCAPDSLDSAHATTPSSMRDSHFSTAPSRCSASAVVFCSKAARSRSTPVTAIRKSWPPAWRRP